MGVRKRDGIHVHTHTRVPSRSPPFPKSPQNSGKLFIGQAAALCLEG